MQHTDKALAELLKLLQAKSPEAMAWIMDIGYRQAYVTGWFFLGLAVLGVIIFIVCCVGLYTKWKVSVDDIDDPVVVTCVFLLFVGLLSAVSAAGFGYCALTRLANPGYFVYQMLTMLIPGQ